MPFNHPAQEIAMLRFHELAPSPNSIKVRLALRTKGIEFETLPVDPSDRSDTLTLSGQVLTPVIEDKGIVLYDSEAILHYLDANYRGEVTRLYASDRAGRKACDGWRKTVYERVVPASGALFMHSIGMAEDPGEAGRRAFREACEWAQAHLGEGGELLDHPWPVCEIWLASWMCYAFPSAGMIERVPLFERIASTYGAEAGVYPQLESWLAGWTDKLG